MMVPRPEKLYRYVSPEAIRSRSASAPGGTPVVNRENLRSWLDGLDVRGSVGQVAATLVIDLEGRLRLADRRSEHAVAGTLDEIGLDHPGRSTTEIVFRRCPACGERNVAKDDWFICLVCDGNLAEFWNFEAG